MTAAELLEVTVFNTDGLLPAIIQDDEPALRELLPLRTKD